MPAPGLMFVTSKAKDHVSDEQYNRFYNEEHLPDVLKYGLCEIALRYKNTNPKAKIPYLALYPIADAGYFTSPDAGKIVEETRISKTFNNEDIYNHIDFGLRPYEKIQTFEGYGHADKSGTERGKTIVCVAMEPADGEDEDFDEWYALLMSRRLLQCLKHADPHALRS